MLPFRETYDSRTVLKCLGCLPKRKLSISKISYIFLFYRQKFISYFDNLIWEIQLPEKYKQNLDASEICFPTKAISQIFEVLLIVATYIDADRSRLSSYCVYIIFEASPLTRTTNHEFTVYSEER
jgi:hypothetical protein